MSASSLTSYYLGWQSTPYLRRVRLATATASLLLSVLALLLNDLPNNDAYTYVRAAELALESGLAAAYQHYQWAHLSVLMAGFQRFAGLDLFAAAWLINALLFALLSVAFVNLVAALTASRRVVWLAALCVLVYPHLNEFRSLIVRDTGFLAFSLVAVLQLVRYQQWLRIRYAAGFIAACLAASLFRPEALVFMLLTPAALLLDTRHELGTRCRIWLRLVGLALVLLITLAAAFALSGIDFAAQLHVFLEVYQPFLNNVVQLFSNVPADLETAVFGTYAAQFVGDYSHLFLLAGLAALVIACVVDSLGLAAAPLLLYGLLRRHLRLPGDAQRVILAWIAVSVLILLTFTLLTRFITTRYTLLLALLLLIYAPFVIDRAWSQAVARGRRRRFAVIMGLLLTYSVLDAHVSFGPPKQHLVDGTQWLVANTRETAPLLTNEMYIAYQSGRVTDYDRVQREMPADALLHATPGTIIAVLPRRSFAAVLESEVRRGALRRLHHEPAARGADLYIYEKLAP